MTKNLYRIYDSKTGTFDRIWAAVNDADAMRAVQSVLAGDGPTPYRQHAEDYTLFRVGKISDDRPCPDAEIAEEVCGLYSLRDNPRVQAFADAHQPGHDPNQTVLPLAAVKEG